MKRFLFAAAAFLGANLAIATLAAPARNWIATITPAKGGSYVVGNPAAKAKLVEYLSFTCSHCAHFAGEAWPALERDYVAKGTTSIEVRHAVRDPMDMAASLLSRCDGPARFLGHSEAIFAAQSDWMQKGASFATANAETLQKLPIDQALGQIAQNSGLTRLMRSRGMPQAKINACLASKTKQAELAGMADEAWRQRKIGGTPAFFLNGSAVPEAHDWGGLKPALDAAVN
jgi:protein-disulfide isomerase